jgi:thiamine-phosphate pyrophosphorylase
VLLNGSFVPVRREALAAARLYLVLDLSPATEAIVAAALRGGVDVVQLRDKGAGDAQIVATGGSLAALCRAAGALFFVNDRPDLALACGADGVHVGQEDVSVDEARRALGAERLIGLSTHSPAQFDAAGDSGADYASVGPVWETPTKEGRAAVGLELVRHAAAHATLPFFAIGGIDETNVGEVVAAGATRIAVVRAIRDAAEPEQTTRRLRAALPG